MSHIVLKLGGTALSDADAFRRAVAIIQSNPQYAIVVPSAPATDQWRMTELLKQIHDQPEERARLYWTIQEYLVRIVRDLRLGRGLEEWFAFEITRLSEHVEGPDYNPSYVTSRGEYWSGVILSQLLKWPLISPLIRFYRNGGFNERATRKAFRKVQLPERYVMPGFYGEDVRGRIHLFPRNGSDISAAVTASQTRASELHIGRKGGRGIYAVNPAMYEGPQTSLQIISVMSHEHAREMTYRSDSGALHPLALIPVAKAGIQVRIFDVETPSRPGTRIVCPGDPALPRPGTLIGIAERAGFTSFTVKRVGLNEHGGFMDRVGEILKDFGRDYEHEATGVDHVSIVIRDEVLRGRQDEVAEALRTHLQAKVDICRQQASICLVGTELGSNLTRLGSLFIALGTHCGVCAERRGDEMRLSLISQTNAGTSIVLGVPDRLMRTAVNRLYKESIRKP